MVVDEELVAKVMLLYGLTTKRAAIEFALKRVAGENDRSLIRELEGSGWEGDLDAMRRSEIEQI